MVARHAAWLIILAGLAAGLLVLAAERLALGTDKATPDLDELLAARSVAPFAGLRSDDLRRSLVLNWRSLGPDAASERLLDLAKGYPLDSELWMVLARIAAEPGGLSPSSSADALALATASAPRAGSAHREAAQLAMLAGDFDAADRHLREQLAQTPAATGEVLITARRWHPAPDRLVAAVLPASEQQFSAAMRLARQERDLGLAQVLWDRRPFQPDLDDSFFLDYVDTLLRDGEAALAAQVWRELDPHFPDGAVPNWNFARPLGTGRGFNWSQRMPAGSQLFRDSSTYHSSPASLRVIFDGSHNVRLNAPSLTIPVEPDTDYLLHGYWRGEGLTTRSLPYLSLQVSGRRGSHRAEVTAGSFDWSEWQIRFRSAADTATVRLALGRDETRDFDRYIAGRIWIDSIRLERVDDEAGEVDGD